MLNNDNQFGQITSSASLKAPSTVNRKIANISIGKYELEELLDSRSERSYISEIVVEPYLKFNLTVTISSLG